jgi:hypothetical protein
MGSRSVWIAAALAVSALMIVLFLGSKREGLTSLPTPSEKKKYASEVMENRHLFSASSGSLDKARSKMPWMDPVVFEDIRRANNFTLEALENLF